MTTDAQTPKPRAVGYEPETLEQLCTDAATIMGRYPNARSALLPMLHLVQSVDGYVTRRGIQFCADQLDLTAAEVSAVATFYTQYKRRPNGDYTVGVCTNTLCAVMGGDAIYEELSTYLGIGHDETTDDGKITLERVECNAGCDYAPVVMVNWEFFDNQTPDSMKKIVDELRLGNDVTQVVAPRKCATSNTSHESLQGSTTALPTKDPAQVTPQSKGRASRNTAVTTPQSSPPQPPPQTQANHTPVTKGPPQNDPPPKEHPRATTGRT